MTSDQAAEVCQGAIMTALVIGGPILLSALLTSLIVGLLQSVTQLQEQTISLIPRLAIVSLVLMFFLPWGLNRLTEYATTLIRAIPGTISHGA